MNHLSTDHYCDLISNSDFVYMICKSTSIIRNYIKSFKYTIFYILIEIINIFIKKLSFDKHWTTGNKLRHIIRTHLKSKLYLSKVEKNNEE